MRPVPFSDPQGYNQRDSWKRIFVATAKAKGVHSILDIGYSPSLNEVLLFNKQKITIAQVLTSM